MQQREPMGRKALQEARRPGGNGGLWATTSSERNWRSSSRTASRQKSSPRRGRTSQRQQESPRRCTTTPGSSRARDRYGGEQRGTRSWMWRQVNSGGWMVRPSATEETERKEEDVGGRASAERGRGFLREDGVDKCARRCNTRRIMCVILRPVAVVTMPMSLRGISATGPTSRQRPRS